MLGMAYMSTRRERQLPIMYHQINTVQGRPVSKSARVSRGASSLQSRVGSLQRFWTYNFNVRDTTLRRSAFAFLLKY